VGAEAVGKNSNAITSPLGHKMDHSNMAGRMASREGAAVVAAQTVAGHRIIGPRPHGHKTRRRRPNL